MKNLTGCTVDYSWMFAMFCQTESLNFSSNGLYNRSFFEQDLNVYTPGDKSFYITDLLSVMNSTREKPELFYVQNMTQDLVGKFKLTGDDY